MMIRSHSPTLKQHNLSAEDYHPRIDTLPTKSDARLSPPPMLSSRLSTCFASSSGFQNLSKTGYSLLIVEKLLRHSPYDD